MHNTVNAILVEPMSIDFSRKENSILDKAKLFVSNKILTEKIENNKSFKFGPRLNLSSKYPIIKNKKKKR
tara:strand:+ start:326 stop:535 length:210 start_codon:yes stop_codon:yes gene_type:complete